MTSGDAPPGGGLPGAPLRPESVTVRPTPLGRMLLVATSLVLVLAWIGAGTPFAIVAMLCGALAIVAAVSSWRHASALRIAAPAPVTAFSNERFVLDVPVANLARRAAAFDVLVTFDGAEPGARRVGAFVPTLAAGDAVRIEAVHPTLRRGLHDQGAIELSSAFPLGLFTCRLRFALPHEILVLPRLGTIGRIERAGAIARGDSGHGSAGRGDEQEIYGIRAWRDGEGLRSVHWKLSARRGRLLVREFRSEPRLPVHVVLATSIHEDTRGNRHAFEDAVSLAATLVEHQVQSGHAVRLTLLGHRSRTIACRRGRGAILPVLRALAEASAEVHVNPPRSLTMPTRVRADEKTYVVRAGPGTNHASSGDGSVTVFDMTDRDLASVFDRRRRPGRELLLGVRR